MRYFNSVSSPLQRFSSASRFECVSNCLNINQNCTGRHSASINKKKNPTDCRACVHVAWPTLWKSSLGGRREPPAACLKRPCWINGGGKRQHVSSPSHSTLGHPTIRHEHTCCWNSAVSHARHSHTDTHKHKAEPLWAQWSGRASSTMCPRPSPYVRSNAATLRGANPKQHSTAVRLQAFTLSMPDNETLFFPFSSFESLILLHADLNSAFYVPPTPRANIHGSITHVQQ